VKMQMTGGNGLLSVPSEHMPGLFALCITLGVFLLGYGIVRMAAGRDRRWAVWVETRLERLTFSERLAVGAMILGAAVHAAIVPTHWGEDRVLAVLFVADAVGFLAAATWMVVAGRYRKTFAAAMLGGTVVGYVFYLIKGWETADLVGLLVTSVELAGFVVLALSHVPALAATRRRVALAGSSLTASLALLVGAAALSSALAPSAASASAAPLSVPTTSPAGPVIWPQQMGSMEKGMQMVTPDCTTVPTDAQQQAAVSLVDNTVAASQQYQSLDAAKAAGYVPITPTGRRIVHYAKPATLTNTPLLDPNAMQSLVYANTSHGAVLVAAMYMMGMNEVGAKPPMPGGCLTEWHVHTNLCFSTTSGKVVGIQRSRAGTCRPGSVNHVSQPMIHVWLVPVPGGPLTVDASSRQVLQAAATLPARSVPNPVA
jgi:hypothetical protein